MNLNIRSARVGDVAVICDFNCRLAKESENKELDLALLSPGVLAVLGDPHKGRYFVAETDGTIVGQLGITTEWSDWRNGYFWWIQSVYVVPDARRQGVFRALFDHVLRTARAEPDVIGIRLYVDHDNHGAQATYRSMGLEMTHYEVMEKYPL